MPREGEGYAGWFVTISRLLDLAGDGRDGEEGHDAVHLRSRVTWVQENVRSACSKFILGFNDH